MPAMSDRRRSDSRAVLRCSRMNSPRSCQRSGNSFMPATYATAASAPKAGRAAPATTPARPAGSARAVGGEASHQVEQFQGAERLGEEGVGARLATRRLQGRIIARGEDDDLDALVVE